jgi:hypothetical protein
MPNRPARQHSREIFADEDTVLPTNQGDTASVDAFGRSRISEPETLFDSSFEYDIQPLFWVPSLSGGADIAHDSDKRAASMTVSGSTAGTAILQSFAYCPYQKGKSQRTLATFVLGSRANGITRRVGYFDASDGVFFEQTNDGLFLVLRSSTSGAVVNTRIAQADWSQNSFQGDGDKIGGANSIDLDETRRQILDVDVEWLGVGRVRYGFNVDGRTVYAHYVNNANAGAAAPYMRSGTLPVRYEIANDGTGVASAGLVAICAAVFSEGGFEVGRGIPYTANRGDVAASVGSRVPVLSIRPKGTFNSIVNRSQITPLDFNIFTATQSVLVEVVYNGLLFGTGSFVSVDDNSAVEFNNSFTAISGGFPVQSFYVSTAGTGVNARGAGASPILSKLPLTLDIDGANPIPLSIVCTPLTGTAAVHASINWDEVR